MRDLTGDKACVIVGTGLAGGNCAVTLREEGWRGRIVMLGREARVPFGRPPLSKTYLRGEEPISAWYVKPAEWYDDNNVELRTGETVQMVDPTLKHVSLAGGDTVKYDKLLLSTGGRNRRLDLPGAGLAGVHQLRTLAECDAIRANARPGRRAVIVGMGFIGSEVAASLRQMGLEVTAVFSGAAPLERVVGGEVATVLAGIHRGHGVQLMTNDRVIAFEGVDRLERVVTGQGARLECDLAVVGAGIEPDVGAFGNGHIALDNGVLVDESCRASAPDVYAAGDIANHLHPLFGRLRVEHFNNAEKQGQAAARAILGDPRPYDYIHSFWSDQYEHSIEYVGFARSWDQVVVRGSMEEQKFLVFYLASGVMKAALGLNRGGDPEAEPESELRACQALIREQTQLTEETLADDSIDLRSLALT
jgi:3-phenylpropionate/trans-cinnamate dioxygenase ferredoxin reductase component